MAPGRVLGRPFRAPLPLPRNNLARVRRLSTSSLSEVLPSRKALPPCTGERSSIQNPGRQRPRARARLGPGGTPLWVRSPTATSLGPVDTDLLLRGITSARNPATAWLRKRAGAARSIRSARFPVSGALSRGPKAIPILCPGRGQFVQRAKDAGEALLFAMQAAVTATRATAGLVHRVREPLSGSSRRRCWGACMDHQLGQVGPKSDPCARPGGERCFLPLFDGRNRRCARRSAIARRFSVCEGSCVAWRWCRVAWPLASRDD